MKNNIKLLYQNIMKIFLEKILLKYIFRKKMCKIIIKNNIIKMFI